jgi:hypothetical protein
MKPEELLHPDATISEWNYSEERLTGGGRIPGGEG